MEILRGGGSLNFLKENTNLKCHFHMAWMGKGRGGGSQTKTLYKGGMDIFWNNIMSLWMKFWDCMT